IAVPEGTPVKAAENGVVIYAGDGLKEFGNTVLVRHEDGLVTVYGHASELKVARGDKVRRGQEIARSGMSGSADLPKLHFEVRKDSVPVNPTGYLE
ncbi:MAG: M23 family metallopeptidase, partial [Nitratireductor sp.]